MGKSVVDLRPREVVCGIRQSLRLLFSKLDRPSPESPTDDCAGGVQFILGAYQAQR